MHGGKSSSPRSSEPIPNEEGATTLPPKIAIIYTHFPHYRAPVFEALSRSVRYDFSFYYDPSGIDETIATGEAAVNHYQLNVISWRGLLWQRGALSLACCSKLDGYIFLGNPFIISTWIAAILVRLRGKPVLFWTHGWLRQEVGIKAWIRRRFYKLADGLLVYGARARALGEAMGFDPASIHVINNSLDYSAQRHARERVLKEGILGRNGLPRKPFFLVVSRLVKSVSLDIAVEAMAQMSTEVALVVVGDGPERDNLETMAEALGIDVFFTGAIYDEDRLARFFMGSHAVVSPGKVGLLAMHALAYGTPVITHNDFDRQMPEVEAIEPGTSGAFFRYGDSADLAEKMETFLRLPPESRSAGRAAAISRIEEKYTPDMQVTYISDVLDLLIKRTS